jgi:hypothetical protein
MKKQWLAYAAVGVLVLGGAFVTSHGPATSAGSVSPATGFTLHIDADQHFGDKDPTKIAHHWCRPVSADLTECQLYDADSPHGRLVGVETVVPAAVWAKLPKAEQAMWHYHKTELKKIHATLPDVPAKDQAKVIASLEPTYGKVWMMWDPSKSASPVGSPWVTVLH